MNALALLLTALISIVSVCGNGFAEMNDAIDWVRSPNDRARGLRTFARIVTELRY